MINTTYNLSSLVNTNYSYATSRLYGQANANALKTINAMGLIADNFNITIFPDLAELLVTSRTFIRFVCDYKINKAYSDEPDFNIASEDFDKNLIEKILIQAKKQATKIQDLHHPLGTLSAYESTKEACRLALRHGGAFIMFSYADEETWETEIDLDNIDTKRKLIVTPISLCNNNRATALQYIQIFQNNQHKEYEQQYKEYEQKFEKEPNKYYATSGISFLTQKTIRLFINNTYNEIHTSRLLPVRSGIKNYTSTALTQMWDNSILQGSIRSIAIYYMFLNKYLPELLQEKVRTNVMLGGYNLNQMNGDDTAVFEDYQKALALNWTNRSVGIFPENTSISQINTNLADLQVIFQILKEQIASEFGIPLIEIDGNSASGLNATGDDTMALNEARTKETHCQFDGYFEYVLQRIFYNRFAKSLPDLQLADIDIILTNKPTLTPEKQDLSNTNFIDSILKLQQGGIIQTDQAIQMINQKEIPNMKITTQDFFDK